MGKVAPIRLIEDFYKDRQAFGGLPNSARRPLDSKVQGVVQSQIPRLAEGTLLASATSPRIVIDLIPTLTLPNSSDFPVRKERKQRQPLKSVRHGHQIPVGISRCDLFPPLNAIMQLILFLPAFRDVFTFAPRSYAALSDFLDQYAMDQEKSAPCSTADSNQLLRLLIQKMPPNFFRYQACRVDIREFIYSLIMTVLGKSSVNHCDVNWDTITPFSFAVDLPSRPPDVFVTVKNSGEGDSCYLIQRQFFTSPDSYCYDLDAFVEYRPDGQSKPGEYIPYLKINGVWYQCDDDRITPMRSNQLNMAQYRSILLHYKRIWPK